MTYVNVYQRLMSGDAVLPSKLFQGIKGLLGRIPQCKTPIQVPRFVIMETVEDAKWIVENVNGTFGVERWP